MVELLCLPLNVKIPYFAQRCLKISPFFKLNISISFLKNYTHTHTHKYILIWASLVAQTIKNPPAKWETLPQALSYEDPLEREMATHSNKARGQRSLDRGAWWVTVHGHTRVILDSVTKPPPPLYPDIL